MGTQQPYFTYQFKHKENLLYTHFPLKNDRLIKMINYSLKWSFISQEILPWSEEGDVARISYQQGLMSPQHKNWEWSRATVLMKDSNSPAFPSCCLYSDFSLSPTSEPSCSGINYICPTKLMSFSQYKMASDKASILHPPISNLTITDPAQ